MPTGSLRTRYPVVGDKKICTKCLVDKPLDGFYRNPKRNYKPYPMCKLCAKSLHIKYKFGMEYSTYQRLLNLTGNKCQICEGSNDLVIDHDHTNGWVRGILCRDCNLALGHLKDNRVYLEKGIQYLLRRATPPEQPGYLEQYAGAN